MQNLLIGLVLFAILTVGMLFVWYWFRMGSVEDAASEVSSHFIGVTLGGLTAIAIVIGEIGAALIGWLITSPEIFGVILMGMLGSLTIEGVISGNQTTWGIITMGVMLIVLGARRSEGSTS